MSKLDAERYAREIAELDREIAVLQFRREGLLSLKRLAEYREAQPRTHKAQVY